MVRRTRAAAGVALLAFANAACGDDGSPSDQGSPAAVPGELTLEHRGSTSLEEAARRSPALTVVRARGAFRCRVEADAASAPEWIEAAFSDGRILARSDATTKPVPAAITFDLPLTFSGRLVSRVRYTSGEIWRRESTLP